MRWWAGAILALLACGVVAPAPIQAGCVHAISHERPVVVAHFDRLISAGAMPGSADQSPPDRANHSTPCQGASCSQPSPDSQAPLAPSSIGRLHQWVFLTDRLAIPALESHPGPLDDIDGRPTRLAPSIFHPPRPI